MTTDTTSEVRAALARAGDRDAPVRDRLAALVTLATAAARGAVDPAAARLLDDSALVDAALGAGLSGAVTGLALALGDALSTSDRRTLAAIALGAGAGGVHVAALALAGGDPRAAARAAAPELRAASPGAAPIHARILARWTGEDAFWAALRDELGADAPRVAGALGPHAPDLAGRICPS